VAVDSLTSIVGGVVVFGTLGTLATSIGTDDVQSVVKGGVGLAFVVYPEAVSSMKIWPRFFAACFFLALITLGIDSEFAMLEVGIASFLDRFPKYKENRAVVAGIASLICCILGIFMCTSRGVYIVALFDEFASTLGVLTVAVFEILSIVYIYGANNMLDKLSKLMRVKINLYWKICLYSTCPILVLIVYVATLVTWKIPKTGSEKDSPPFPWWALAFGWAMLVAALFPTLYFFIYSLIEHHKKGNIKKAFQPTEQWESQLQHRIDDYNELEAEKQRRREYKSTKYAQSVKTVNVDPKNKESLVPIRLPLLPPETQ